jgi:hypothetical protein
MINEETLNKLLDLAIRNGIKICILYSKEQTWYRYYAIEDEFFELNEEFKTEDVFKFKDKLMGEETMAKTPYMRLPDNFESKMKALTDKIYRPSDSNYIEMFICGDNGGSVHFTFVADYIEPPFKFYPLAKFKNFCKYVESECQNLTHI